MSRPVSYTSAVTVSLASFSGLTGISTGTTYPATYGVNTSANTSNTSYARLSGSTQNSSGYAYYLFEELNIPSIAVITSVSCSVRCRASATGTTSGTCFVELVSGPTTKGSATTVTGTTATAYTLNTGSQWTANEANHLGVKVTVYKAISSNNRSYGIYFYGATLTVNYTVDGIAYEINASSETSLATVSPSSQEIFQGESGVVKIETDNIGDIVVEDNGVDVTDQLVIKERLPKVVESVAQSNFTTGTSTTGVTFYTSSNSQTTSHLERAIGYTAENPNPNTATGTGVGNYTYVKGSGSNVSGATGWINFTFDFSSIPSDAIITDVSVKCYGAKESGDNYDYAKIGLYSGDVLKSTEQEFSSSSNQIITISNPGTWSRSELDNAVLRFTVGFYGGRIGGITWSVTYKDNNSNPYYYEYTVANIDADRTILVSENVIIPPEEDSGKTYYPITISSINAITNPVKGTTRVESGTSQTITITPSDPQLTLALDNGVDVTSQLVAHGEAIPDPIVGTALGASYGFNLNSSTGYYVSTNAGQSNSAAVARVTFNLPVRCLITIQYINYAEATYDYGIFGNIDTALNTGYTADSNAYKILSSSSDNTSTPQTLTYEIESGEHFIDIKYRKDSYTDDNNDNLQFKITNIEKLEMDNYYTYDLNNINQSHSLIFIFGDVTYYFVTSNTSSDAKLYPNGQMVALPGDDYRLTIVPEKSTDTVSLTDNGTDVTGNLERKEVQTEKEGQTITTVNYIYRLTNIQAAHTLNVSSSGGQILSVMSGGTWVSATKVFKRDERGWNEVSNYENLFDSGKIYIPKQG